MDKYEDKLIAIELFVFIIYAIVLTYGLCVNTILSLIFVLLVSIVPLIASVSGAYFFIHVNENDIYKKYGKISIIMIVMLFITYPIVIYDLLIVASFL